MQFNQNTFVISTDPWPTQGDENAFCPATALHGSFALPFVIPTERYPAVACRPIHFVEAGFGNVAK
jgi:hypothetical protein